MTNTKTYFRDLSSDKQKETTEDMLRVNRELHDKVESTFEKVNRLLIGFNAGGILLISGWMAGLADALPTSGLLALVTAGKFFLFGLICSGTPAFLFLIRFRRMAPDTLDDINLVHTNELSIDDAEARLESRTDKPRFARCIDLLLVAAFLLFLGGTVNALVAVASLSSVPLGS